MKLYHRPTLLLLFLFFIFTTSSYTPLYSQSKKTRTKLIIKGLNSPKIEKHFNESSELRKLNSSTPPDKNKLLKAIEEDKLLLQEALHAFFFFDYQLSVKHFKKNDSLYIVQFTIRKNKRYQFKDFKLIFHGPSPATQPSLYELGIKTEQSANYFVIEKAGKQAVKFYQNQGYPFAEAEAIKLQVDKKNKEVIATQKIKLSSPYIIGQTSLSGAKRIPRSLVYKYLFWKEGDTFSLEKIQDSKQALEETLWFSSVHITHPPESQIRDGDPIPLDIKLQERKHRELAVGLKYNTQEQLGAVVEWEHRNLLHKGYYLKTKLDASRFKKNAQLYFLHPDRWDKKNIFGFQTGAAHEKLNNNLSNERFFIQPFIKHKANQKLNYQLGVSYELSKDQADIKNQRSNLLSLPLRIIWSSKKQNPLNTGTLFKANFTPFFKASKQSHSFFSSSLGYHHGLQVQEEASLSFWGDIASLQGANLESIPSHHRLFGGSGRLFRGYSYHSVPYSQDKERSLGGRSLYLLGIEWRSQIYQDWYYTIFFESGNVFTTSFVKFQKKPLKSIGIGINYFLGKLPVKLELAFPIDRRQKSATEMLDKRTWQLYMQVGESF